MSKSYSHVLAAAACGLSLLVTSQAAPAQSATTENTLAASADTSSGGKIGRVHDKLRRAAASGCPRRDLEHAHTAQDGAP